jgi:hypothetical protein
MHFKVKAGKLQTMYLVSVYINITLSWHGLDRGSGYKLFQRDKIFRNVNFGCD